MTATTPTLQRKRRTEPATPDAILNLLPSHHTILEILTDYRYLTPRLLSIPYGTRNGRDGRGLKYIQNQLGDLYHHGYVQRFYRSQRPSGYGSDQMVYVATHKGARAVSSPTDYMLERRALYNRAKQRASYEHHLGVSVLQMILELATKRWQLLEFIPDEERDQSRKLETLVNGEPTGFWPDASALIRFPDDTKDPGDQQTLYLFELDLARRSNARMRDRFLAYANHSRDRRQELAGLRKDKKTVPYNNVVTVFIAPTAIDRKRHRNLANQSLRTWSGKRPLFLFWSYEDWWDQLELSTTRDGQERTWKVPVLRKPERILDRDTIQTLGGDNRRLVEFH